MQNYPGYVTGDYQYDDCQDRGDGEWNPEGGSNDHNGQLEGNKRTCFVNCALDFVG